MTKSILIMTKREVELEKIRLQNQGLLSDACWRLDEMLRAIKMRGDKNVRPSTAN